MIAISLREAANRARLTASIHSNPAEQVRWFALATLLDGDGEGGLLALHIPLGQHSGECETCADSYPCPTLTLVAAYVSGVLGMEVTA